MKRNRAAKEAVINYLLENPDKRFYLTQIAAATSVSDTTVQRILEIEVRRKFVVKEKTGNLSYYFVDLENPLVREAKISRTLGEIAELIDQIKEDSVKIILFGSCAKGEDTADSDIDLLVLANRKEFIEEAIRRQKAKRVIRVITKTYPEWVSLPKENAYLYGEINKGRVLWERRYG